MLHDYEYGAANRLTRTQNHKGESVGYQYNGLGYRTGRNEASYLFDFTKSYNNLLGIQDAKGRKSFYYDGSAAIMEEVENDRSRLHYYLLDELGSPTRLLDGQGLAEEIYGYDEFGNDLYGNQGIFQPFGYTGYQYDPAGATYYAQAREYQPETGRFISRDSEAYIYLEIPGSLNLYTYCASNPLNFIDPTGHDCFEGEEAVWKTEKFWNNILTGIALTLTTAAAVVGTALFTVGTAGLGPLIAAIMVCGFGATGAVALNDVTKNQNSSRTAYMAAGGFGSLAGAYGGGAFNIYMSQQMYQGGAALVPGQIVANANFGNSGTVWDKINSTAGNIPNTNIPATFQLTLDNAINYTNPQTYTNTLWTNANATKHMGEYISRFGGETTSTGIRSQALLANYQAAVNQAMNELIAQPLGRYFGVYGNWELGINTETGVIYHALMY